MTKRKTKKSSDVNEKVKTFIQKHCTHTKGEWAGKPFLLLPWQIELIDKLFGTIKPNGYRQYRYCYTEIPKKNGKTELAAAIALYMLICDDEGAEVYSAAADTQQASLVYNVAAQMVRNSEKLYEALTINETVKRIVYPKNASVYQVLSAEHETKHGLNPSCILFDELHSQPNDKLWNVLTSGTHYARKQQIVFVMSTAGVWDTESIWWKVREKAVRVKNGIIDDPTFLPILYIADKEKDDPKDEDLWIRVNPSIGRIFTLDTIREDFKIANDSMIDYNNFLRFRLNIPVSSIDTWIKGEQWDACYEDFSEDDLVGRECFTGMDLGATDDLTALIHLFPMEDDTFRMLCRFWMPDKNILAKETKHGVPYNQWIRQGFMNVTSGDVTDFDHIIYQTLEKDVEKFNIQKLVSDKWQAAYVWQKLQSDLGFQVDAEYQTKLIIDFPQSVRNYDSPTRELEKHIRAVKIKHNGNPIMKWMITNTVLRPPDAFGKVRPDKIMSGNKIDGTVALIMALSQAVLKEPQPEVSIAFV